MLLILLENRLSIGFAYGEYWLLNGANYFSKLYSFIVFGRIEPAKYTFHIECIASDSKMLVDVDPLNGNLQYL